MCLDFKKCILKKNEGSDDMFDFKFDWQPDLDSTIEEVDTQHKQLFKVGRDMEQLLRIQCIGVTDKQLLDIVCQLRDFVAYHFYVEEEMMHEMEYSRFEEHKKKHEEYAAYVMGIDMHKLKENPVLELKQIKDEIKKWIFEHMLYDDRDLSQEYLKFKQGKDEKLSEEKAEQPLVYVEGVGYEICKLDATIVYLPDDQRQKGHVIVAYKDVVKDFAKLTALERNTFFSELTKTIKALKKIYEFSSYDCVSFGSTLKSFDFHIIPKYGEKDGLTKQYFKKENVCQLSEEEIKERVKEIRTALNK